MRVNGVEILPEVINRCIRRMKEGDSFTFACIEEAADHHESNRLVDRLLQRERKAGNIEYRKGAWHWIGPR